MLTIRMTLDNMQVRALVSWLEDVQEATADVLTVGAVRLTSEGEETLTVAMAAAMQLLGQLRGHLGHIAVPAMTEHVESERRAAVVQRSTASLRRHRLRGVS